MSYRIMSWLFFGGADKIEHKEIETKEAADGICDTLNEENLDSMYSGFYVKEN